RSRRTVASSTSRRAASRAHAEGVRSPGRSRTRAGGGRQPAHPLARGLGHDLVRLVEDDRRARRVAPPEARRPFAHRNGARRRLPASHVSRRVLLAFLGLVVVVLAALLVPLGVQHARTERRDLETKVERDAVALASL